MNGNLLQCSRFGLREKGSPPLQGSFLHNLCYETAIASHDKGSALSCQNADFSDNDTFTYSTLII